jgi:hypothetical protein
VPLSFVFLFFPGVVGGEAVPAGETVISNPNWLGLMFPVSPASCQFD